LRVGVVRLTKGSGIGGCLISPHAKDEERPFAEFWKFGPK
jgi:hypothetical protein